MQLDRREHQARRWDLVHLQSRGATRGTQSSWEAGKVQETKVKVAGPGEQPATDRNGPMAMVSSTARASLESLGSKAESWRCCCVTLNETLNLSLFKWTPISQTTKRLMYNPSLQGCLSL